MSLHEDGLGNEQPSTTTSVAENNSNSDSSKVISKGLENSGGTGQESDIIGHHSIKSEKEASFHQIDNDGEDENTVEDEVKTEVKKEVLAEEEDEVVRTDTESVVSLDRVKVEGSDVSGSNNNSNRIMLKTIDSSQVNSPQHLSSSNNTHSSSSTSVSEGSGTNSVGAEDQQQACSSSSPPEHHKSKSLSNINQSRTAGVIHYSHHNHHNHPHQQQQQQSNILHNPAMSPHSQQHHHHPHNHQQHQQHKSKILSVVLICKFLLLKWKRL